MTRLSVTLTCNNAVVGRYLFNRLHASYMDEAYHLSQSEKVVTLQTVLSDEKWAEKTAYFTKMYPSAIVDMRASASFGNGFYKVYKSTFKNGIEHEEEPEEHSVYDEDMEVANAYH